MYYGGYCISSEKWQTIYEDCGGKRKNGYISTPERIKAKKKHHKKKK